ncbi:ATP F0F1 synthase synthase [Pasteurella canis]|uniref:ATP F0F1 synthase synthase n=1 Tax=Pasteurella canis TaxID=753 RepID=UPI001D108CF8|nr:ATP F0F1 synthase synthase [Pasteurella canis]UDW83461.1 ATP F0F1 synthase synthase [Pasteurella canis]
MDQVLAKASRKLGKLISDQRLFDDIKFNSSLYIDYNSDHNLDEECWFCIKEFSTKDYCLDWLKEDFDSKNLDTLNKSDFVKIKYLVSVQQSENVFCFQKITPALFLKKKMLCLNETAELQENESMLVIHSEPDAIYFKNTDIFVFKRLPVISSIFKGIDSLYKEATNSEVETFLSNPLIDLTQEFNKEKVSKPNRKRIAMAMDTLGGFDNEKIEQIIQYIKTYCSNKLIFDEETKSFTISSDDQLKILLYGIEQRFYTTEVDKEKRLANSIVRFE